MVRLHSLRLAALALAAASPAFAQSTLPRPRVAVGAQASTLGVGGDVAVGFGSRLAIRGAIHRGTVGTDREVDDISYRATAHADAMSVALDVHPFGNRFYLTAGVVQQKTALRLLGQPSGASYSIDDYDYPSSAVGTLRGVVTMPEQGTLLGLGFDRTFVKESRVSLGFRAGVVLQGDAMVSLVADGPIAQDQSQAGTEFRSRLEAERANAESKINDQAIVHAMPTIEMTLRVRLF